MTEKSKQIIQLKISRLKYLPALPESSLKILDAINDPDVPIDKLAEVLSMSPGLAARLLGLANSAYFGHSRQINDLHTAIIQVLGIDLVKSLSLGVVLNVHFDAHKCQAFSTEYFWMRSLLTALAAQKLAIISNGSQPFSAATSYTSGLLLYIGVLVLAYLMPDDMDIILQRSHKNGVGVSEVIRRKLGETHYRVGYFLLQKWQLSSVYQSVLSHFEDSDFCGEERPLIDLLKLSQYLSSRLLSEDAVDIEALEEWSNKLSLPTAELRKIVEKLIESRENIQKLAYILGGK
ncbi:MAG: HDOD domain-containing protein [Methylomonas sp.]